ncbi:hypothetical protein GLAREA_02996 [Glarea lozoyensis ATCC 20868]|uniref:Uncharacterized protein n=1 Tax=Glarea lozoyensis (strain ATCC 20868 / MF5171) TaxID=1116229 RepID=S3CKM1_GLAL2|nr:uncharacterized protein GLAREA_02996 [Glarea lozoyensis ATCC 20868]EPE27082.1 hypothetical protein GLAREA_02996 [Glarea lozoyensis ATCC 20868]
MNEMFLNSIQTGTPHIITPVPNDKLTKIWQKLEGEVKGASNGQIWGAIVGSLVGAAIVCGCMFYMIWKDTRGSHYQEADRTRRDLELGNLQQSDDPLHAKTRSSNITGNKEDEILTLGQEVAGRSSMADSKELDDVKTSVAEPAPAYIPHLR